MMKAWRDDMPACRRHYAQLYVSAYPKNMYGWMVLADALAAMALYAEGYAALRKSLRFCPESRMYQVYAQMGHFYDTKCDLCAAEKWYRRAVAEFPRQENLIFLGACLAKRGKFHEAKSMHRRAARKKPESADEAYYNLGLICRAEEKYKQAIAYFSKAIAIDPNYKLAKEAKRDVEKLSVSQDVS